MKQLFAASHLKLLIIGAFRSNEVDSSHPLMSMVTELHRSEQTIREADAARTSAANGAKAAWASHISQLQLQTLGQSDISHLLADTFHCDHAAVASLANLLFQQTAGSPFFINTLLSAYHRDELLRFDYELGTWSWDIAALRVTRIGTLDNVVALLEEQVKRLPAPDQDVLASAACLGNQFGLATLALVARTSEIALAQRLWKLVQHGFLTPRGSAGELFALATDSSIEPLCSSDIGLEPELTRKSVANVQFNFRHDSVQQASYQLLNAAQRVQRHLLIGRSMLREMQRSGAGVPSATGTAADAVLPRGAFYGSALADGAQVISVIDAADQFNHALDTLTDSRELREVVFLNRQAAQKARASTAFDRCLYYSQRASQAMHQMAAVLHVDPWCDELQPLAFVVTSDLGLSHTLASNFAEADAVLAQLLQALHTDEPVLANQAPPPGALIEQQVQALLLHAQALVVQPTKVVLSIEQTMKALAKLRVRILAVDSPDFQAMRQVDPAELVNLREATDQQHLQAMNTCCSILSPCFVGQAGQQERLQLVVCTMMSQAMQFGASIYLSCALVFYGGTLCASSDVKDMGACVRAAQAGMELCDRFRKSHLATGIMLARIGAPFYAVCSSWGAHMSVAGPAQWQVYLDAVECGELEYAGYGMWHSCGALFFTADPLLQLEERLDDRRRGALRAGRLNHMQYAIYVQHAVQRLLLQKQFDAPFLYDGRMLSSTAAIAQMRASGVDLFAHFLLVLDQMHLYLSGNYTGAAALCPQLTQTRRSTGGHVYLAIDLFYSAASILRAVPVDALLKERVQQLLLRVHANESEPTPSENDESPAQVSVAIQCQAALAKVLPEFRSYLRRFEAWSVHAPMNFLHRVHFLQAEYMRVRVFAEGRVELIPATLRRYQLAQDLARSNRYTQDEALAAEMQGRFHVELDSFALALPCLRAAYRAYQRWQCVLKVQQMKRDWWQHPQLLAAVAAETSPVHSQPPAPDMIRLLVDGGLFAAAGDGVEEEGASDAAGPESVSSLPASRGDTFDTSTSVVSPSPISPPPAAATAMATGGQVYATVPVASDGIEGSDVAVLLRFLRVFSLQLSPRQLLQLAMEQLLQCSGASSGVLVYHNPQQADAWAVELIMRASELHAPTSAAPETAAASNLASDAFCVEFPHPNALVSQYIPAALFHYVLNGREALTLSEPCNIRPEQLFGPIAADAYFALHHPRAVFACPIMKQGKAAGVLYLENAYHSQAFMRSQSALLQLLCSLVALSIDNARLYSKLTDSHISLEELVAYRTLELKDNNRQLVIAKEAAESATAVKSDFLSSMSHEVRTPLNAMLGVTRLLETTELSMEQQVYVGMIGNSGQVLLSIVNG